MAQNDKNLSLSYSISQEPYIIWLSFMVHICKMISSGFFFFFHFFKNFIFQYVRWVKCQKMAQNGKIFRLSHSISQEAYMIWSWFLLHMCKMMICSFFSQFRFSRLLGRWKSKNWPKMIKNSVRLTPYLRNRTSYDCDVWYTCVRWWYLQQFFPFLQNFDFYGF